MSCDVVTSAETWSLPRNGYNYNHTAKYYCVTQSTQRKFRSQASDNMERWKAETRKVEERKGKSQKKEDTGAGNVGKVEKHAETLSFFRMICGSGGSKSRLLKAAAFSSQDAAKSICGLTSVNQVSDVRGIRKTWFYHFGHLTSTKWRKGYDERAARRSWTLVFRHSFGRPKSTKRRDGCFRDVQNSRFATNDGRVVSCCGPPNPPSAKKRIGEQHFEQRPLPAAIFLSSFSRSLSQQLPSAVFLNSLSQPSSCCGQGLVASYYLLPSTNRFFERTLCCAFGKAARTGGAKQVSKSKCKKTWWLFRGIDVEKRW